jgi:hypothetical protein
LIANETSGNGFRGVAEYVTFEKDTVASNESFFQLAQPIDGTHGRSFELPRISDHQSRFNGLRASRTAKPADSLSSLSGRRLVPLKDQPQLLLPGNARANMELGHADAANGLRRPSAGQARAGGTQLGDHEVRGEYIGGTLIGSPREMSRQAAPFRSARADAKAPVMHYSLALEAGDGLKTKEEWVAMVTSFLDKMGFDRKHGAWASWIHRDTDFDHAHIVFLRSMGDGSLWNREFSARRAIEATAQIEREFGLRTHDRTPKKEKRALTRKEKELEQLLGKEGKKLNKSEIIKQIDAATERLQAEHPAGYSLAQFSEALKSRGIEVEAYAPKGRLSGLKYARDGMWVSGSTLGSAYSPNGLFQRGLLDLHAEVLGAPTDAPKAPAMALELPISVPTSAAQTEKAITPAQAEIAGKALDKAKVDAQKQFQEAHQVGVSEHLIRMALAMALMLAKVIERMFGLQPGALGSWEYTPQGGPRAVPPTPTAGADLTALAQAQAKLAAQLNKLTEALKTGDMNKLPELPDERLKALREQFAAANRKAAGDKDEDDEGRQARLRAMREGDRP